MSSYISFSAVLIYGLSYIHLQNKKDTKRDFATITKDSKILRWDQNFPIHNFPSTIHRPFYSVDNSVRYVQYLCI